MPGDIRPAIMPDIITNPAPQVTPAYVEANIKAEVYFTGDEAACVSAAIGAANKDASLIPDLSDDDLDHLGMLTFCVLVTHNGHLVSGEAYCADPAKFNAETGRKEARKVAINKLWPMVVYAERERLAAGGA